MQKKERRKGDIKVKTGNKREKDKNRKLYMYTHNLTVND